MQIDRRMKSLNMLLRRVLCAALLIAGCDDLPSNNPDPNADMARTLLSLQLSPTNGSIAKGTQQQLIATAIFSDGTTQNVSQQASWSATDVAPAANVATVSASGLVTGQNPGRATLGVAFQGKTDATQLTVTAAVLTALAVSPTNPSIANGTTQQFTATGTFSDGSRQDVSGMATWSATDVAPATHVATITSAGLVTTKSPGQATIAAALMGQTGATKLTVTAAVLASIAVSPNNPSAAKGTSQQFTASGTFSDGSTQDVSAMVAWSATDVAPATSVAAISSTGLATAKNLGQATITAALLGKTDATKLTVTAATLAAIAVSPSNPSVAKGTTQQFTAKATFSDGSSQDVTSLAMWSTTDVAPAVDVAAITGAGLATAKNLGQATVAATWMGKSDATKLTATAAALSTIAVSPSNPSLAKGTTQQFTATGTYSDGSTQDISTMVSWSATDVPPARNVAAITGSGLATAKNLGQTTLAAVLLGKTGSTQLTVTAAVLTAVAVSPTNPSLAKGTTQQFTATATFSDASTQDVSTLATWSATDVAPALNVAAVSSAGLATAKNLGQASLAAAWMGKTGTTQLTVTAAALASLAVSPPTPSLAKGTTQQFTATGTFTDGSTQNVSGMATWSTADVAPALDVAAITGAGLATAKNLGQATVTATLMGKTDAAKLTVTAAVLAAIAVTPSAPSLANGTTQGFAALATFSDGSTQNVTTMATWSATDVAPAMNVATITAAGLLTAKSLGQVTVAAAFMGKTGSTQATVTPPTPSFLRLAPANPAVSKGTTQQVTAYLVYSDGTTQDVTAMATFTAVDVVPATAVATISAGGLASANNLGRATVTAVAMGMTGTTTLTVHTPAVFCNPGSWCWRNPFPAGSELLAVWENGTTGNSWAVGESGTIVTWTGASRLWNTLPSGTTNTLNSVWGTSASSIWAVGDNGTIVYWNGSSWSAQTSGTTASLYKVWGADATHVWAVGANGIILQWDGSAWRSQMSGTLSSLTGVWGLDATHVWGVGAGGAIVKWDGTAWKPQASFSSNLLNSVWASDNSHVWATGDNGTILQWDGSSWGTQTSGITESLRAVWGIDATHLWAVSNRGTILTGDGTTWSYRGGSNLGTLNGVWISDASHMWLAGGRRGLGKWDGISWSALGTDIAVESPEAIWGPDASHVWAVGTGGLVAFWDGLTWSLQTSPSFSNLMAIWGIDAHNVWAVDDYNEIIHWNGSSWTGTTVTSGGLYGLWGSDANNIWAVGANGYIFHWDGKNWGRQTSGTTRYLAAVWGTDATNVWAAGAAGTLLKWDGSSWAVQTSGTTEYLTGIWGSDSKNVWVIGTGGTLLKWDGSAWRHPSSGVTTSLNRIWGTSATNFFVSTDGGILRKWDGSTWSSQNTGLSNLAALWGSEDSHLWVGGDSGALLEHTP